MNTAITMYTTEHCPFCSRAKALLAARGVTQITEVDVDQSDAALQEMMQRTGRRTVPQIYIGERHVGGFDDLAAADRRGDLARWLAGSETMALPQT
ncbi:MAG: glutaredoxin 3 [Gammaproteobacteria bacterium]|nr:glutaredoxin 3 [Gammaproteobacteria bacterium]